MHNLLIMHVYRGSDVRYCTLRRVPPRCRTVVAAPELAPESCCDNTINLHNKKNSAGGCTPRGISICPLCTLMRRRIVAVSKRQATFTRRVIFTVATPSPRTRGRPCTTACCCEDTVASFTSSARSPMTQPIPYGLAAAARRLQKREATQQKLLRA